MLCEKISFRSVKIRGAFFYSAIFHLKQIFNKIILTFGFLNLHTTAAEAIVNHLLHHLARRSSPCRRHSPSHLHRCLLDRSHPQGPKLRDTHRTD